MNPQSESKDAAAGANLKCVICDLPATKQAIPSATHLRRNLEKGDDAVKIETEPLPKFDLCDIHMHELAQQKITFGWCDELSCRRWGRLGSISPCGLPYVRV